MDGRVSVRMRAVAASCVLGAVVFATCGRASAEEADLSRTGVSHVVELFSSQGCSSCPPAERTLSKLDGDPSVLALSYHVDYWDYIGWRDIYGSAENTARQKAYGAAFDLSSLYTPQMVINGRTQIVASDSEAVEETIASVPAIDDASDAWVRMETDGEHVQIQAQVTNPMVGGPTPVLILVTFDEAAQTRVSRGENRGQTLVETHPVRGWRILGMWSGEPLKISLPIATLTEGANGPSGCAALVQAMSADGSPGPILAAERIEFPEQSTR